MTDQEIYQSWIDHMTNNSGMKFTGNEHMMRMITSWVSPEEAAFTTGFPLFPPRTIEEIAEIKQMEIPELKEKIEALARKGMIYEAIQGDSVRYRMWSVRGDLHEGPGMGRQGLRAVQDDGPPRKQMVSHNENGGKNRRPCRSEIHSDP